MNIYLFSSLHFCVQRLRVADSSVVGDDSLTFDDDGEEYEGKKGAKAEICEEEVSNSMMLFFFTVASGSISVCYS